jgi:predicted nucleic acid-binding protein
MRYLLDTDTLIDYIQDLGSTRTRVNGMLHNGDEVALCPITTTELHSGLSPQNRSKWHEFLAALPYWVISRDVAAQAGIDRKAASDGGRTLPLTDAMIAALARAHQATILTSNIKHYRTEDVDVLSLRDET